MSAAAERLAALSRWIDDAPANAARDPEAALWARVSKVGEEFGEAIQALIGATGQNPRKGVTHTFGDVIQELLDTALTALCAVEHMTGNRGNSMIALDAKVSQVYERAGLAALDGETKRSTVPPPDPGMAVRACCGDTHLGDGCDPSALGGAE